MKKLFVVVASEAHEGCSYPLGVYTTRKKACAAVTFYVAGNRYIQDRGDRHKIYICELHLNASLIAEGSENHALEHVQ